MRIKRVMASFLCAAMVIGSLSACGGGAGGGTAPAPAASGGEASSSAETASSGGESGGTEADSGTKYKEEIIIAMADEFTTIDPTETTSETNQIVQELVINMLTNTNLHTITNEGEILESWEMIEPDHWKFYIKPGIKFHDGTTLDVYDVEWTLMERCPDKATASNYVAKIAEFIVVDDLTFECKLVSGDVDFNYTFAANALSIQSKEAFETMPEEEAVKIGTGPFMFEEFVAGDYVSLVRFEDSTLYPVPNTKRLVFRMIPEASARMIALENGEVDVIMSPDATDYSRLSENDAFQLLTITGRGQHFVGFNLLNPDSIVTDPKFREAVAKGIDKEEMIIAAWDGYAQASTSIHCRDVDYYADIEGIPYDPEGAQALFDELGCNGMTIRLVTSDADHRVKMAENFQAQMAKYGITINVEYMQNSALTELNTSDGTTSGVELYIASWTPGKNADYMYRNPIHSQGGRNYSHLIDPEIDALIDEAAGEVDTTRRAALYEELQQKLTCEIIHWVPIAQATLTMGAAEGVEGILLHPALNHSFKGVQRVISE
ncbi:MAG: ABC transporter substrate-binding protein [Lachnospiraceae bacterium]|nr:ABC transporter substrate-binding protein [Lachnospiraceae bacterium]